MFFLVVAAVCSAAEVPSTTISADAGTEANTHPAAEATANSEVAVCIALIKNGDFRKAALLLREVVKLAPDNLEANFYLGVALNRLSEKEAENVLKASLMQMPDSPYVNFELGLYYFNAKVDSEAGDYMENVIALSPNSDYAVQARVYLKQIEERGKEKRWEVNILTGMQYDSNVIVIGDGPLPEGVTRRSDFNAVINPKGSYFLIKNEDMDLTASYSLYQTLHTQLTAFDVTQNTLDLSGTYGLGPKAKLKGSYSFEYLFLGGNRYDHAHVFAPGLLYDFGKWGSTVLDYKYRTTSYINSAAFTTNTDRNGDNHYGGITHTVPVGKSNFVWGGFSHDEDLTQNDYWNYHGNRLAIGFRGSLPHDAMADISGEFYHKDYAAMDPSYDAVRFDNQFMATLTLIKMLSPTFTLMVMEQYTRDISNISAFNTVRMVTSLFVNARF